MTVYITALFNPRINSKELLLLLKTAQKESVIEDRSILADNVGIGSIGDKTGQGVFLSPIDNHQKM